MSECVVRMEMPQGCEDCPFMDFQLCCCVKERKYVGGSAVRPNWCPIICQLPEGHGRLVDAEILRAKLIEHIAETNGFYNAFNETPTIVPEERSEHENPQHKIEH